MRTFLGLLVLLAGAVVLALVLGLHTHGYVAVRVGQTLVRADLPMAVVLWLAAGGVLLGLWSLIAALLRGGTWLADIGAERRRRLARLQLVKGLIELSEGRYARAERRLSRTARHAEAPFVHHLMAARAAQLLGSDERRDRHLRAAYESTPEAQRAVLLTQAEFQIARHRYEHALATLQRLETIAPRDPERRRLLARVYEEVGDHTALGALLPALERSHALPTDELVRLQRVVFIGRLTSKECRPTASAMLALYEKLSESNRRDPTVQRTTVEALLEMGETTKAVSFLERLLAESGWNEDLVRLYGDLEGVDPAARILVAEGWRELHDDSPGLHHALGVLHARLGHQGQARTHLERSLRLSRDPRTILAYVRLLQELGEDEAAATLACEALELVVGSSGELIRSPRRGLPASVATPPSA